MPPGGLLRAASENGGNEAANFTYHDSVLCHLFARFGVGKVHTLCVSVSLDDGIGQRILGPHSRLGDNVATAGRRTQACFSVIDSLVSNS